MQIKDKLYIFQTLFHGKTAESSMHDLRSTLSVAIGAFEALDAFHRDTSYSHNDPGFYNFVVDEETNVTHIIDFGDAKQSDSYREDNLKLVNWFFSALGIAQNSAPLLKKREALLGNEAIFDAIVELAVLSHMQPTFFETLGPTIEKMRTAYQRQFFPSAQHPLMPTRPLQPEIDRVKILFRTQFDMPIEEYVQKECELYKQRFDVQNFDFLRVDIEKHKRQRLGYGFFTGQVLDHIQQELLSRKNFVIYASSGPYTGDKDAEEKRIIKLIGDLECLKIPVTDYAKMSLKVLPVILVSLIILAATQMSSLRD